MQVNLIKLFEESERRFGKVDLEFYAEVFGVTVAELKAAHELERQGGA